jgi:cytochrome P450
MTSTADAAPIDIAFDDLALDDVSALLSQFFEDPSRFADPFALFRRLRTLEPVHWSRHGTWVITGYPEAREVLRHPGLGRRASAEQQFGALASPTDSTEAQHAVAIMLASLINRDPPDHTRLRRLVSAPFTPRAVNGWRPRIEARVAELVDAVADRDEFDFLPELAYRLPESIICELLRVPVSDLRSLSSSFGSSRLMTVRGESSDGVAPTPADLRAATVLQMAEQVAYFREVVEDRRRHPGDDLISALVAAEDDGERLTMDELIGTVIILIGAGHETTANLVGNGMLALLRTPDAYARLRADTDVLPAVLEEIIRYASPSPGQPRTALEPIEVAGRTIAAGQQIFPILNAANRDPRVFAAPERFDIDRPNNRDHITFTEGIHHCLGAALARVEATALFRAVATQLRPLELARETLAWRPTYVRGLTALPVRQVRQVRP